MQTGFKFFSFKKSVTVLETFVAKGGAFVELYLFIVKLKLLFFNILILLLIFVIYSLLP
jgi:hypothetical protein